MHSGADGYGLMATPGMGVGAGVIVGTGVADGTAGVAVFAGVWVGVIVGMALAGTSVGWISVAVGVMTAVAVGGASVAVLAGVTVGAGVQLATGTPPNEQWVCTVPTGATVLAPLGPLIPRGVAVGAGPGAPQAASSRPRSRIRI